MRLNSKKSVNKLGVVGRVLSSLPEVAVSGREVENIDTRPGLMQCLAP
jgi:hypothetical protein